MNLRRLLCKTSKCILLALILSACGAQAAKPAPATSLPTPAVMPGSTLAPQPADTPTIDPAELRTVILAAFHAQKDKSWRYQSDTQTADGDSGHTVVEYVPPDRYHIVSDADTELIVIGEQVYVKQSSQWKPAQIPAAQIIDFDSLQRLEESLAEIQCTGPETLGDKPMRVCEYQSRTKLGESQPLVQTKLWIGSDDGLPYKMVVDGQVATLNSSSGEITGVEAVVTITYAYDPGIQIEAPRSFESWFAETQSQALANSEAQKDRVEALFGAAEKLSLTVAQRVGADGNPFAFVATVDDRPQAEKDASIDLTGIPLQITAADDGEWAWREANLKNVAGPGHTHMLAWADISDAAWDGDHIDTSPPFHLQTGNTYAQTEQLILENFDSIAPEGVNSPERLIDYPTRPPGHFNYFAAENGLKLVIGAFFRGHFTHSHPDRTPKTDEEVDAFVTGRIDYVLDVVALQANNGHGAIPEIIFANEGVSDDGGLEDTFMARRFNVDGNNWYTEAYVRIVEAAEARGLVLGKDYKMVVGEYGIEINQQKAESFVDLIQTVKVQAAERLDVTPAEIPMEVWDQFHTYGGRGDQSGMGFYNLASVDEAGIEAIIQRLQWIQSEIGPIQIGELDISGAKDEAERMAVLEKVTRICKEVHCTSIGLYAPFSTEEENIGIFQFDEQSKTMQKTGLYYIYMKFLLSMLDSS